MAKYIRIDKLDEELSDMDWYHLNRNGELKQGAEGTDNALYKATDIFNAINKLEREAPDVVEVKHGRWLYDEYGWECSECGYPRARREGKSAYCPNCGSRMDLEGDAE